MPRTFTLGSRASKLAQVQTLIVRDVLQTAHPDDEFDLSFMTTGGDQNQTQALYLLGGKSLWTEELEEALLKGDIDMIVHSLKDVSTILPEGCEIGAIMERENPCDSLVVKKGLPYKSLEELPDGSVVGTSSVRRVAQLRRAFPKLVFADVRGNLNTRLAKLDRPDEEYAAIILARAGLVRLDMEERITSDISPPTLYHAVGQGALGIEIRSDDVEVKGLLASLSHRETELRCRAERACLRVLEGGCSVPVGVASHVAPGSVLSLTGTVTSLTGDPQVVHTLSAQVLTFEDAEELGANVGHVLIENGAKAVLEEVSLSREAKLKRDENKAAEAERQATTAGLADARPIISGSHVDSFLNPKIELSPMLMVCRSELRRDFPGAWPME